MRDIVVGIGEQLGERRLGDRVVIAAEGRSMGRRHTPEWASATDRDLSPSVMARDDMLELAFTFTARNGVSGDYFEFGSSGARTFRLAFSASRAVYVRPDRPQLPHLYAFDSFEGLPEPQGPDRDERWTRGDYATSLDEFRRLVEGAGIGGDEYTTIAGFYADSLTPELRQRLRGVRAAVVWLDCDFHDSARDVLAFLPPFLVQGSVVCMDDWNCFRAADDHGERLAVREWLAEHPELRLEPWVPFGWHGQSFLVHRAGAEADCGTGIPAT